MIHIISTIYPTVGLLINQLSQQAATYPTPRCTPYISDLDTTYYNPLLQGGPPSYINNQKPTQRVHHNLPSGFD